jgi:hypothetical protein
MCRELHLALRNVLAQLGLSSSLSATYPVFLQWLGSCTCRYARGWGTFGGRQVTTLFGTPEVQSSRKHSLLPVLVALFLLSYGLMTLLIVEQGSTIQSQRSLIRQLLSDSTELSTIKGKAMEQQHTQTQAQANAPQNSPVQTPSTQAPSEKTSTAHKSAKARRPLPERPPVPTSDIADARRSLMSI